MQEKLNQFERNEECELVRRPSNQSVIGTRWVFRNKMDENDMIVRNKARLVAQGFNREEGIDSSRFMLCTNSLYETNT